MGLSWAAAHMTYTSQILAQEQGAFKGGILADKMGLGKTIQVSFLPSRCAKEAI